MKNVIFYIIFLFSINLFSQDYSEKVKTIDSTISTLYQVISGEKGEERNWELFKYLFYENAKLVPIRIDKEGNVGTRSMTPEGYIKNSSSWLVENGFFEKEIGRKIDQFGNIAHIFSSYESFHSEKDPKPFTRGLNSIQLLYDGNRWWILTVYWQSESKEHPIPKKYIDKKV